MYYTCRVRNSPYALEPEAFLRAIDATRATLGEARMKLLDIVDRVRELTDDAPYAVIGGLAQILWARKSHTDDLHVALASADLVKAYERTSGGGSVVDLITFADEEFTREVIQSARPAPELGGIRFVRPELLLVTHLLRPTVEAKLAAVELLIARRDEATFDMAYARAWAARVGAEPAFDRIRELAQRFADI